MHDAMSQTDAIREHLLTGRSITPLEALRQYGCMRLGARIEELRKSGMPIETTMDPDPQTGKRYASYRHVPAETQMRML